MNDYIDNDIDMTDEEKRRQKAYERGEHEIMVAVNKICRIPVTELNQTNIEFLRARRSYLTGDQLKKFESILEDPEEGDEKGEKKSRIGEYNELKKEAEKLGIKIEKGMGLEQIKDLILRNS